jgi:hypothetical protein
VTHSYLSTACYHGKHGTPCRNTCKFCDSPCVCPCHTEGEREWPETWVEQARGIARELRDSIRPADVPDELQVRIGTDPALFWLRDEPWPAGRFLPESGTWHVPEKEG